MIGRLQAWRVARAREAARAFRYQRWGDMPLLLPPGVLDPVTTRVGAAVAQHMATAVRPGERWLDMGCGSGLIGLAMARAGAVVTCVDIDPAALQAARTNAKLWGVALEVVGSDLFAALPGRDWDGVIANLPFWPGDGRGMPFSLALFEGAHDPVGRFLAEAPARARRVWLALSHRGGHAQRAEARWPGLTPLTTLSLHGEAIPLYTYRS